MGQYSSPNASYYWNYAREARLKLLDGNMTGKLLDFQLDSPVSRPSCFCVVVVDRSGKSIPGGVEFVFIDSFSYQIRFYFISSFNA